MRGSLDERLARLGGGAAAWLSGGAAVLRRSGSALEAPGCLAHGRAGRPVGRRAGAAALLALALGTAALAPSPGLAEATPRGGATDARIRTAVYDADQVYAIETTLGFSTTIRLGPGERFAAVVAGDTESFQVDPIPELGNVVTLKPRVAGATTNMTIVTDARSYNFILREGRSRTQFFEVRFTVPGGRAGGEATRRASAGWDDTSKAPATAAAARASSAGAASAAPARFTYFASGGGDIRPTAVWDDGRYTYFRFAEEARQPAIFRAEASGRERSVNWTQRGDAVRVRGVNRDWTLRLGDEVVCVRRDPVA